MRRQLSEQKSDFLDWHMSDEWKPFKVVRSQHDESNTFFEKAQLGTAWESNDQTNRRIHALARRSAICWMAERRTVKGSGLWACWKDARLVLHGFAWTPKTHTLCVRILKRDHETLQWSFRTLSVYFGSTCILIVQSHMWGGGRVCRKDGLPLILGLSFQYRLMADSMALRLSMWQYTTNLFAGLDTWWLSNSNC